MNRFMITRDVCSSTNDETAISELMENIKMVRIVMVGNIKKNNHTHT